MLLNLIDDTWHDFTFLKKFPVEEGMHALGKISRSAVAIQ
jgi:hypothetical protein